MFIIDIEDASGTKQGSGPITTAVEFYRRRGLDQIGEARFRVPAGDPQADPIQAGRYYHVYRRDPIKQTRMDLGAWKHRAARVIQDGDESWAEIDCYGLEVELVNESVYFNRNYSNTATNTIVAALVALASGWSSGTISNPGNITVGFQGESIFRAIASIAEAWRYHFRQGTTARTLDFGQFGSDSGIRLIMPRAVRIGMEDHDEIALITGIEILEETDRVVNKIVPLGAGLGEQQLTIQGATATLPAYPVQTGVNADASNYYYIHDTTSIATYGTVAIPLVFADVRPLSNSDADVTNAKNVLYRRAVSALMALKDPTTVYGVTCTKLRGSLEVGDKIRLVYRGIVKRDGTNYKFVDVDALQYVLAIEETFDRDGREEYRLEVSANAERVGSDGDLVSDMQHSIEVWKTHLQTYPCRSLDTRYEEMDSSHDMDIPIDIDDAVLYLNSALIRLKSRPLRATATGAASGGGSVETSGASSTSTTGSGGATTPTTTSENAHRHKMMDNLLSSGTPDGYARFNAKDDASGTNNVTILLAYQSPAPDDDLYTYAQLAAHDHDVTIPNHTHGMDHTHQITIPNHTHNLDYGIYDDTQYPDTIRIEIDGTDRTSALGGPWGVGGGAINVELDITTYLVNAAGGLRQEHTVTISCDSGQGTVESVVKLQMTVQGIAVS